MNFNKIFGDIMKNIESDIIDDHSENTVSDIQEACRSPEAVVSADIINKLFADRKLKDENGNIIQVTDPATISDGISKVNKGVLVKLDEGQDRFLRSDILHGTKAVNIPYSS